MPLLVIFPAFAFPLRSKASILPPCRKTRARNRTGWKLLLLLALPYAGLCIPALYARATPALFGFPFFYWYQFAWVLLASALMAVVYRKLR